MSIDEHCLVIFSDILLFVGGVIPPQDYDFLYKAGAAAIFGPGKKYLNFC